MTVSILDDVLKLKNDTPEKLQEYFKSINLPLFDTIFHSAQNLDEAKQKILYIIVAFSEDSPLLIIRQDSKEEKEGICEYLQIPDFMRHKLTTLTETEVRQATTQYLIKFAGPLFKSLMFMKIQYDDLELDITNRVFKTIKTEKDDEGNEKTTETPDPKEQGKAVTELARLAKLIEGTEKQMRSQNNYPGIMEMKDWKDRGPGKKIALGGHGISIEHSSLIKKRKNG